MRDKGKHLLAVDTVTQCFDSWLSCTPVSTPSIMAESEAYQ